MRNRLIKDLDTPDLYFKTRSVILYAAQAWDDHGLTEGPEVRLRTTKLYPTGKRS